MSRAGGQPLAHCARGKSGLHTAGRWVTPSGGNPKESATENTPLPDGSKGEMVG